VPQVEVTFDIDANGILHVSAKDKATGKEQSIEIRASSGLNEAEIERMVRDAEAHAEEDKKFQALAAARNQADNLIHAASKSLGELGDKVSTNDRTAVEAAIDGLKSVLKGDDKDEIESRTKALEELFGKLAQQAYSQQAGENPTDAGFTDAAQKASTKKENVVDAEFEEVKDDKK
jgi:molecular chaperone DnaK